MNQDYQLAKAKYESMGIDTEQVIASLQSVPISVHCWQGDDVKGFDFDGELSGGIQTTGNYLGRARTPEELMALKGKYYRLVEIQSMSDKIAESRRAENFE